MFSTGHYVSIKVLTGHATKLIEDGLMQEHEIMHRLAARYPNGWESSHCVQLHDHFIRPGTEAGDGQHMCLVMDLFSVNVYEYHGALEKAFSLPLIKRILKQALIGLGHLHSCGVAHTGENVPLEVLTASISPFY